MNWVGGARNRLRIQNDKRQKEYFEKKKFINRVENASNSPNKDSGLNYDLLSIKTISKTPIEQRKKYSNTKCGHHVRAVNLSTVDTLNRTSYTELPNMSPIRSLSKLHLNKASESPAQQDCDNKPCKWRWDPCKSLRKRQTSRTSPVEAHPKKHCSGKNAKLSTYASSSSFHTLESSSIKNVTGKHIFTSKYDVSETEPETPFLPYSRPAPSSSKLKKSSLLKKAALQQPQTSTPMFAAPNRLNHYSVRFAKKQSPHASTSVEDFKATPLTKYAHAVKKESIVPELPINPLKIILDDASYNNTHLRINFSRDSTNSSGKNIPSIGCDAPIMTELPQEEAADVYFPEKHLSASNAPSSSVTTNKAHVKVDSNDIGNHIQLPSNTSVKNGHVQNDTEREPSMPVMSAQRCDNWLVFLSGAHSPATLSCHGNTADGSPNVDRQQEMGNVSTSDCVRPGRADVTHRAMASAVAAEMMSGSDVGGGGDTEECSFINPTDMGASIGCLRTHQIPHDHNNPGRRACQFDDTTPPYTHGDHQQQQWLSTGVKPIPEGSTQVNSHLPPRPPTPARAAAEVDNTQMNQAQQATIPDESKVLAHSISVGVQVGGLYDNASVAVQAGMMSLFSTSIGLQVDLDQLTGMHSVPFQPCVHSHRVEGPISPKSDHEALVIKASADIQNETTSSPTTSQPSKHTINCFVVNDAPNFSSTTCTSDYLTKCHPRMQTLTSCIACQLNSPIDFGKELQELSTKSCIDLQDSLTKSCTDLPNLSMKSNTSLQDLSLKSCSHMQNLTVKSRTDLQDQTMKSHTDLKDLTLKSHTDLQDWPMKSCKVLPDLNLMSRTDLQDLSMKSRTDLQDLSMISNTDQHFQLANKDDRQSETHELPECMLRPHCQYQISTQETLVSRHTGSQVDAYRHIAETVQTPSRKTDRVVINSDTSPFISIGGGLLVDVSAEAHSSTSMYCELGQPQPPSGGEDCKSLAEAKVFVTHDNVGADIASESNFSEMDNEPVSGKTSGEPMSGDRSKGPVKGEISKELVSGETIKGATIGEMSKGPVSGEICGKTSKGPVSDQTSTGTVSGDISKSPLSGETTEEPVSGEMSEGPVNAKTSEGPVSGKMINEPVCSEMSEGLVSGEISGGPVSGEMLSDHKSCENANDSDNVKTSCSTTASLSTNPAPFQLLGFHKHEI